MTLAELLKEEHDVPRLDIFQYPHRFLPDYLVSPPALRPREARAGRATSKVSRRGAQLPQLLATASRDCAVVSARRSCKTAATAI